MKTEQQNTTIPQKRVYLKQHIYSNQPNMKLFVVICSLMVSTCTAQLRDPSTVDVNENRTPECPSQPPAQPSRERRQAPPKLFSWFTTNGDVITKEECEARNNANPALAQKGPVLVQRGVYDVCVKFDEAPTWFFTQNGTNALCDPTLRCCEWFPPYHNPCSSVRGILWLEAKAGADCDTAFSNWEAKGEERATLFGVDYIYGAMKGENRRVCHVTNPDPFLAGEKPELLTLDVEITYCGEKCCIYQQVDAKQ